MSNKIPFWQFFSEIELPSSLKDRTTFHSGNITDKDKVSEFNKINIFIGPNNSGKSFVLRNLLDLLKYCDYKILLPESLIVELKLNIDENISKIYNKIIQYGARRINDYDSTDLTNKIKKLSEKLESKKFIDYQNYSDLKCLFQLFDENSNFDSMNVDFTTTLESGKITQVKRNKEITTQLKDTFKTTFEIIETIKKLEIDSIHLKHVPNNNNLPKYYIPAIRSLRRYRSANNYEDMLGYKTREEYRLHPPWKVENGQSLPNEIKIRRNSNRNNENRLYIYQQFLSKNFFDNKEIFIYNDLSIENQGDYKYDQIKIKIGDEDDRYIHELGDGIQQIIILTFPLFFYESGIVVIEEPEMNIHPGLQKQLMEIYNKCGYADLGGNDYSDNFMFFIATHSNHILDTTLENDNTSIYRVEKVLEPGANTPNFNIHYQKQNSAILDCLGVNASSLFLANGIIWVEGPSDAIYIEHWLNLFINAEGKPMLVKGLHYTFQYLNLFTLNTVGYDNFWSYAEKNPQDVISLADINHNSLFVTDNDGAFDLDADNLSKSKIVGANPTTTKQNSKYTFIEKILEKKSIKTAEIKNAGGEYNNKLVYWINLHTIESYLAHFIAKNGDKSHKFESWIRKKTPTTFKECFEKTKFKQGNFHTVKENRASKVELAREITKDFKGFDDFYDSKSGELYNKINALYNTINSWNKSNQ